MVYKDKYNMKLPTIQTEKSLDITFCGTGKCKCPSVVIEKDNNTVIIGGKEEGFTHFDKEQFQLFIDQAKSGMFDPYI